MTDKTIDKYRKMIDSIDQEILARLSKRAKVVQEIGKIKAKKGEDVFSLDREQQIIHRLLGLNKGALPDEAVEDIFEAIFTAHRSLQRRYHIAYLGPEATFTHQLAVKHFGRNCQYTPLPSIADVFSEVERKRADFGVVPIENSTEGVVNHTLDMFMDSSLVITAEREEPISHGLFSISGQLKSIKSVYSHPQALAQCRRWLEAHLPKVTIHETSSTADAAVHATLDKTSAAIASAMAGKVYHLKSVALKIEDSIDNATRFLIIGRKVPPATGKDKTSIMISIKDKVGALHEILVPFRKTGLNLTKIESRPTKKKAWEYIFFIDFLGHVSEKRAQQALDQLKESCTFIKVLGSYPFGV